MLFVDEEAVAQRLQPIVRHYGERRDDLDRCTENQFKQRTRLNYAAYTKLFRLVEPDITPVTPTNTAIPPYTRLQMTMRFMAQGSMYLLNMPSKRIIKVKLNDNNVTAQANCKFVLPSIHCW